MFGEVGMLFVDFLSQIVNLSTKINHQFCREVNIPTCNCSIGFQFFSFLKRQITSTLSQRTIFLVSHNFKRRVANIFRTERLDNCLAEVPAMHCHKYMAFTLSILVLLNSTFTFTMGPLDFAVNVVVAKIALLTDEFREHSFRVGVAFVIVDLWYVFKNQGLPELPVRSFFR